MLHPPCHTITTILTDIFWKLGVDFAFLSIFDFMFWFRFWWFHSLEIFSKVFWIEISCWVSSFDSHLWCILSSLSRSYVVTISKTIRKNLKKITKYGTQVIISKIAWYVYWGGVRLKMFTRAWVHLSSDVFTANLFIHICTTHMFYVCVCVWRYELVVDAKHFRGESTELVSERGEQTRQMFWCWAFLLS